VRLDRFQHHPWRAANESLDHLSLRELQGERGEHTRSIRTAIGSLSTSTPSQSKITSSTASGIGSRYRVHRYDLRIVNLSLPLSDALVHVSRASLQ
jgi:hypothetical protein